MSDAPHRWEVEFEGGSFSLKCLDPCPEDKEKDSERPLGVVCWCRLESEVAEMMTGKLGVSLQIETEHIPSTVNGPEEWSSWAEVSPAESERADRGTTETGA